MMLAGIVAVANVFMQSEPVVINYSGDEVMGCGSKLHFGITFFVVIIAIVLSIVALVVHWIHYEID